MHEAYGVTSLVKLTSQIESIAACDTILLVGTRQGQLSMYNINEKNEVELMRINKTFSKRPITQIKVIKEHQLLISLCDNFLQVHDLNAINFTVVSQVPRSKGATTFELNIKRETSLTGKDSILVRMAVVVKRKIQLYYLKKNQFETLADDISLNDVPRDILWSDESICVGFKGEYTLFDLTGKPTELFPTSGSRSSEPCMTKASDAIFALCRESQTVLVNSLGKTEINKALKWSDIPLALAWDEPYALAALNDKVEIKSPEADCVIQELPELAKVRFILRVSQGIVFVASISQVWVLKSIDISTQRQHLLKGKYFQLALKLTAISNESQEDKREKVHNIQTLLAHDLFANKMFQESMQEFTKLKTDPYDVIRLFPELLPSGGDTVPPSGGPQLIGKDLETGLLALIDYLVGMRNILQGDLSNIQAKTTMQLLQIIDTTLLKCYLQTNEALVAPLIRLNNCHLAEAEKVLKKMGRHNELVILYQTKGQHRKALELLKNDNAIDKIIIHLQQLGSEHIGLTLEFADWVLSQSEEEGLKIFTEDLAEVESLPRPRILDFLLRSHPNCVIPYLEHVIQNWGDENSLFHNALVHQYRQKAVLLNGEGPRYKFLLIEFLEKSQFYTPESVLANFPPEGLLEERAVILGRLGRHDQALSIYICALDDSERALKYCDHIYTKKATGYKSVYTTLLKLVLNPQSGSWSDYSKDARVLPNLEFALNILENHASRMECLEALSVLPDSIPLTRIRSFVATAFQKTLKERRKVELLKNLLYADHLQKQEVKLSLESQKVLVTEMNVCFVCKKRFGNQSALVRYANGNIVHFSCQEKKL